MTSSQTVHIDNQKDLGSKQLDLSRNENLALDSIERQVMQRIEFSTNVSDTHGEFEKNKEIIAPPNVSNIDHDNNYYKKSQNWIGTIEKIEDSCFEAKLVDLTQSGTYEYASFELDEVSKSDLKLVKLGSLFYYSIGYASNNGQIKKEAFLRFKRSVPFDQGVVEKIEDRITRLNTKIKWS